MRPLVGLSTVGVGLTIHLAYSVSSIKVNKHNYVTRLKYMEFF